MKPCIRVFTNTEGQITKATVFSDEAEIDISDITLADPEIFTEFGDLKITLTAIAITGEAIKEA